MGSPLDCEIFIRHEQNGHTKVLNLDKVQVVDLDINWDDVNPRLVRQTNISTGVSAYTACPYAVINQQEPPNFK